MAERVIVTVLKTVVGHTTVGSNPTGSFPIYLPSYIGIHLVSCQKEPTAVQVINESLGSDTVGMDIDIGWSMNN